MTRTWPHPPLLPLKRLQVDDGLLITAERWELVNAYHRSCLKTHFQAHYLAGIVWGLGVYPVIPPPDIDDAYKDGRWVEIQPGLALDSDGNLIIVEHPLKFRISTQARQAQGETIYLVIRFVNPETLQRIETSNHLLIETFRVDETNIPPEKGEIELCRIQLTPDMLTVNRPQNPLLPPINTLDLRYRCSSESRPKKSLQIAQLMSESLSSTCRLTPALQDLAIALDGLYPSMELRVDDWPIEKFEDPTLSAEVSLLPYDCVAIKVPSHIPLSAEMQDVLRAYLRGSGFLWVELSIEDAGLENLMTVESQLKEHLRRRDPNRITAQSFVSDIESMGGSDSYQALLNEYQSISQALSSRVEQACLPWRTLAQQFGSNLIPWESLSLRHPLRSRPFMFSELPSLASYPVQVWIADTLIVVLGDLSAAWRLDEYNLALPRSSLRVAQEMGINLLHYIEQKQHFQQLLTPVSTAVTSP